MGQSYEEWKAAKPIAKKEPEESPKRDIFEQKHVDSPVKSGIIKGETIHAPIEQCHSEQGNPNAMRLIGAPMNKRQKALLEKLPQTGSRVIVPKRAVSMKDLATLTLETGHEYAMFTKGGQRLIIRGDAIGVDVTYEMARKMAEDGYTWSGHTHTSIETNSLISSNGDQRILEAFQQERSVIYNAKGQYAVFEQEEINENRG